MKSKNYTPIGFLIELMDISIKNMAQSIFVDQSVISRWKSGRRTLTTKCDSFEKIVDYILLHNNTAKNNTLSNLFENLYGAVDYRNKDYMKKCIERFLSHNDVPVEAKSMLAELDGNLYMCQSGVFSGASGRKTAMDLILNAALQSQELIELLIFDRELFRWCIFDDEYFNNWVSRLCTILKNGNKVSIVIETSKTGDVLGLFMERMQILYSFPLYQEYFFVSDINVNLLPTTYNVKNKITALGYNHKASIYTSVFKDAFSVEHGYYYLYDLINECVATVTPKTTTDRINMLSKVIRYEDMDEPCYMMGVRPSFTTIDEELFKQILKDNGIIGELRSILIKYHYAINSKYRIKTDKAKQRIILYYPFLFEYLSRQKIFHHELSFLTGKDIYITNEQYREHLRHTASLAKAQGNLEIAFSSIQDKLPSNSFFIRCTKKFNSLTVDKMIRCNYETSIINAIFSIIDTYWKRSLPQENKDQEYVAAKLLEIANT